MNRRRKLKKLFVLLTLPMVMFLFFNQVAFWHYHVLENGMVVEHSHPFKNNPKPGTPFQKHHHSDFEFTVLAQISHLAGTLLAYLVLGLIINNIAAPLNNFYKAADYRSSYLITEKLRGPPVSI
ncbi:MAG: hypothetical protein K0B37_08930 [Bacteroidales bacterium]|nr:hypothetical protein [Bacteroidales bacterium]